MGFSCVGDNAYRHNFIYSCQHHQPVFPVALFISLYILHCIPFRLTRTTSYLRKYTHTTDHCIAEAWDWEPTGWGSERNSDWIEIDLVEIPISRSNKKNTNRRKWIFAWSQPNEKRSLASDGEWVNTAGDQNTSRTNQKALPPHFSVWRLSNRVSKSNENWLRSSVLPFSFLFFPPPLLPLRVFLPALSKSKAI